MINNNYILTADIGACSLKMAEFLHVKGKLVLVNFAYTEYATEAEEETKITELQRALASVMEKNKFKAKKLYLSISGQSVFTRFVKIPMSMQSKKQKIAQLIKYEAKQNIPFPIEEVTWDYQTIHGFEDHSDEISVMFAVIKTDIINDLVNTFEKKGFETVLVGTSPTASYNCMCASKINEEALSALVNIGGRCTNIVFIDKGKFFARVIPLGGHSITQQISQEMGISFAEAEELKRKEGCIPLNTNYGEEENEKTKLISQIIRSVMTRIYGEIVRSINVYKSQQPENNVSKIYLAGGSSIFNNTDRFLAEKFGLQVEYLNAFKLVSLSKNVNRKKLADVAHTFPELLGLAVNSITACPIEISLLPIPVQKQHIIKEKTPYFFAIVIIIITCLFMACWGLYTQKNLLNDLIINSTNQITKTQANVDTLKSLTCELDAQKTIYSNLVKMLIGRNTWFEILDGIQKSLPDNSWVTLLEPTGKPTIFQVNRTEDAIAKSIFGRQKSKQNILSAAPVSNSIEWIKIKVSTLMLFNSSRTIEAESFKEKLLKQPCFTDDASEIVVVDYKTAMKASDNINSFEMVVKLKTSLSCQ